MGIIALFLTASLVLASTGAWGAPITVELTPDVANPPSPQMGDRLTFHSVIRNFGLEPVDGLMAWINLIRVDPGNEQPVDLEDWSAQKAVTAAHLAPGEALETEWPMRLIQSGRYRVEVSTVSRDGGLIASPFADFTVREKPVVQSERVLPVAVGIPLLLGTLLFWRWRRR